MDIVLKFGGVEYEWHDSVVLEPLVSREWFPKIGTTRVILGHLFYASFVLNLGLKSKVSWRIVGKSNEESNEIVKELLRKRLGVN